MRSFFAGVAAVIMVGLIAGYLLLKSGLIPANADAKPGGVELWAASTSLNATMKREAPRGPNPVTLSDASLSEGIHLYGQHCSLCHGTAAGDATASAVAKGLYPAPPQLATEGVEDDPEGNSYWKIKHGVRLSGMPAWGGTLNDRQIWAIALFLKHMDKLPSGPQAEWKRVKN